MISGRQIRAARAFLIWDRRDLSRNAVMSLATIEFVESSADVSGKAMVSAVSAIQAALEAEGIEFTDDDGIEGVRLHPKAAEQFNMTPARRNKIVVTRLEKRKRGE
jgi:hypothetical protein